MYVPHENEWVVRSKSNKLNRDLTKTTLASSKNNNKCANVMPNYSNIDPSPPNPPSGAEGGWNLVACGLYLMNLTLFANFSLWFGLAWVFLIKAHLVRLLVFWTPPPILWGRYITISVVP